MGDMESWQACEHALHASPHEVSEGGGEGRIRGARLLEPSARTREGIGHGCGEGQLAMQAGCVMGDVVLVGVRWSTPLVRMWATIAPGPRGECRLSKGHEVAVLALVTWIKGERRSVRLGG